jgi:hypothetical protein
VVLLSIMSEHSPRSSRARTLSNQNQTTLSSASAFPNSPSSASTLAASKASSNLFSFLPTWLTEPDPSTKGILIQAYFAIIGLHLLSTLPFIFILSDWIWLLVSILVQLSWYALGREYLRRKIILTEKSSITAAATPSPPPTISRDFGQGAQNGAGALPVAAAYLFEQQHRFLDSPLGPTDAVNIQQFRKQRAWLLQLITAFVSSLIALPSTLILIFSIGNKDVWYSLQGDDHVGARPLCIFFMVQCLLDIIIGLAEYREHLPLPTSWIHHAVYLRLMTWVLGLKSCGTFAAAAINELPSVLLSLGNIDKSLRTDLAFGIVYFATRVSYTILIFIYHVIWVTNSYYFQYVMGVVVIVHIMWFIQWRKSYIRNLSKNSKDRSSTKSEQRSP